MPLCTPDQVDDTGPSLSAVSSRSRRGSLLQGWAAILIVPPTPSKLVLSPLVCVEDMNYLWEAVAGDSNQGTPGQYSESKDVAGPGE